MTHRLIFPGVVDPNQPTTAATAAANPQENPGAAIGDIGTRLHKETQDAATPWFGLAIAAVGIAMFFKRDKRLFLVGGIGLLLLGIVLIGNSTGLVALLTGIADKVLPG